MHGGTVEVRPDQPRLKAKNDLESLVTEAHYGCILDLIMYDPLVKSERLPGMGNGGDSEILGETK